MKVLCLPALLAFALISALPLSAHHSWPVSYEKQITVKGTVVQFAWANPHPMITLDVQGERWLIGGPAINRMVANGWTKETVKSGDMVTGIGYQYSDGEKIIRLERVVLSNGKELRVYGR